MLYNLLGNLQGVPAKGVGRLDGKGIQVKGSSKGWEVHEDKKEVFQAKILEMTRKHKGEGKLHKIIEGMQTISKEIGHETAQTKHAAKSQPTVTPVTYHSPLSKKKTRRGKEPQEKLCVVSHT